jgi:two-component system nitrogen regulation sensor histidine kinase NtrY
MGTQDTTNRRSILSGVPESGLPGSSPRAFWLGLAIVVLSLVSGLATYLILTGLTPIAPRNDVVLLVLMVNVVVIIAMLAVIGAQAYGLWRAWRTRVAGARVHIRIVVLFTLISALPALLLALAATTTFSRSLDNWFAARTRTIVANSLDVARAYVAEHGQVIRTDIVNMAKDLDDAITPGMPEPGSDQAWRNLVLAQAGLRDLALVAVIDAKGAVVFSTAMNGGIAYEPPRAEVIAQAEAGHVPLLMPTEDNRIAAVTKLTRYPGHYLYGARRVSPRVVGHLRRTEAGVAEYERLLQARGGLKLVHGLMYFMLSLTGVLAAIWVGLWFASQLVAPIRRLIRAAQQVATGDLSVELPLYRGEGDLRRLSNDFNLMTRELDRQRSALVAVNAQLDERRRFMEAMLSGVSAGVIGLDAAGIVRIANPSAERLLGIKASDLLGRPLADTIPALAQYCAEAVEQVHGKNRAHGQMTMMVGDEERVFAVQMTKEQAQAEGSDQGSVITFDDITELIAAQRTSAWGDVARRIAHEIKNPLTPIQLSAERIRRKYGRLIEEDRETFDKLTDTIVRQVGDIKAMVDEFAAFARVPQPSFAPHDIREVVQEPMIQYRESHPGIVYEMDLPAAPVVIPCDGRLLAQALTNLVKNATEAVQTRAEAPDAPAGFRGHVRAVVARSDGGVTIDVIDNGPGLPKQNRSRLLEPYVTTKGRKGTGLGLAIVQKIVEQHGGALVLDDAPAGPDGVQAGARISITLPLGRPAAGTDHQTGAPEQSDELRQRQTALTT